MDISREKITASVAREWVEKIPDFQRSADQRLIDRIALAIQSGEWRENGGTIVFNRAGQLIDGQHRMLAIIQANRSVYAIVVRGVDSTEETFQTIDDGKARTVADFFPPPCQAAGSAVAKFYWLAVNGISAVDSRRPPTLACIKTAKPHYDKIRESIRVTTSASKVTGIGTWLAFLWFYYTEIVRLDAAKVTDFFVRLADGTGLGPGSPICALRNRCLRLGRNDRIVRHAMMALVLKALNAHMVGKRLDKISYDPGKESFPEYLSRA